MDTLADVLAAVSERDATAFDAPGRTTAYSAREFATNAWKAGNLLRHDGVRTGSRVGVVVGPKDSGTDTGPGVLRTAPDPVLAAVGATLLGGVAVLDPAPTFEGDALVAPAAWLDRYDTGPGTARVGYGGPPDAPDVVHFEQATWSQNPVEPPEAGDLAPGDAALGDGSVWTHRDLLDAATAVVETHDLGARDRVAVTGTLDGDVFAAGVVAPLLAGATIVGGAGTGADAGETHADTGLVVGDDGAVRSGTGSG